LLYLLNVGDNVIQVLSPVKCFCVTFTAMLKYIAIAILLLPLPSPEPARAKSNDSQRPNAPQLTATPINSPNVQTEQPGPQTPDSQSPKPNSQTDSAKAAQDANNRIATATVVIAVFGVLSFLATCGYIVAAFLQWGRAREQAKKAGEQVVKMQDTLEAIKSQGKTLHNQAIAALSQARWARQTFLEGKQAAEKQLLALQGQWQAMEKALEEQRKMVGQNERVAKATEKSAKTAEEAFHVGEAPYFGITGIGFHDFQAGYWPQLSISFMNGGKTPAWHFYAMPVLIFGHTPETGDYWHLKPKQNFMASTFYPSGEQRQVEYTQTGFQLTEERIQRLRDEDAHLFVVVTINYTDARKVSHLNHTFKCIWNHQAGMFEDYEAA
jgi:hypothetical protein